MGLTCGGCGFDEARWNERDVRTFVEALPRWWAMSGIDGPLPDDLADAVQSMEGAHAAAHRLYDVSRSLPPAGHQGAVVQVNTSNGGVPKTPVLAATVDHNGLHGDKQKERKHHGRQFQAVCLWSAEVIDELAALGHPIAPGSAGENVTISGLDWAAVRPGRLLRIGTVLAEVSFEAVPCVKQAQWFTDGDFRRISYEENPQWVRWYAWVREPGQIATGDPVKSA